MDDPANILHCNTDNFTVFFSVLFCFVLFFSPSDWRLKERRYRLESRKKVIKVTNTSVFVSDVSNLTHVLQNSFVANLQAHSIRIF